MLRSGEMITLGMGTFTVFAVLAGLVLLTGANEAAPGCTGPAVDRCDYIATAKAANDGTKGYAFHPEFGFVVFDDGSSVVVQQVYPHAPGWLVHASSVRIDKRSCQPCGVNSAYLRYPQPPFDAVPGPILLTAPPEDPEAAAKLVENLRRMERGLSPR